VKLLKDINVSGKRVLVRVDFNVEIGQAGQILDDFRLRASLPTIKYLLEQQAGIILLAHLGRPTPETKQEFSLAPVAAKFSELLGQQVSLAADCVGETVRQQAQALKPGQVLLLENLRWHKGEEQNDPGFAAELAALGQVYVNDAFSVSHRAHASAEAITHFLPSAAGLLLEQEVLNLTRARDNAAPPLCVIIGGAKISTKANLILSFFDKAQDIILGGALANSVLHAKGVAVGQSLVEDVGQEIKKLNLGSSKIHLPVDATLCVDKEGVGLCHAGPVGKVGPEELLLDIGPDSARLFAGIISQAKTIIWNGPMGYFENQKFAHGTLAVAQAVAGSGAFSVVGGGETVAFLAKHNLIDKFSFVSTGGGAMLEFLSGQSLPGIEALG